MSYCKLLSTMSAAALLLSGLSAANAASVPMSLTHHGIVWDGDKLFSGNKNIKAELLSVADDNEKEIKTLIDSINIVDGYYSVTIKLDDTDFSKIKEAGGHLAMKITMDGVELSPLVPINSVPYAMVSEYADNAGYVDCEGCVSKAHLDDEVLGILQNASDKTIAPGSITKEKLANDILYAASDVAGGNALEAKHAATADSATKAGTADSATTAGTAEKAKAISSDSIPSGSGTSRPVYIDSNGKFKTADSYPSLDNYLTKSEVLTSSGYINPEKIQKESLYGNTGTTTAAGLFKIGSIGSYDIKDENLTDVDMAPYSKPAFAYGNFRFSYSLSTSTNVYTYSQYFAKGKNYTVKGASTSKRGRFRITFDKAAQNTDYTVLINASGMLDADSTTPNLSYNGKFYTYSIEKANGYFDVQFYYPTFTVSGTSVSMSYVEGCPSVGGTGGQGYSVTFCQPISFVVFR